MSASIVTERLILEPLRVEHADEMVDVLAPEELYVFDGGHPPTLDGLRERYRFQIAGSGTPDAEWRNWIIRTISDQRAIGYVQADITPTEAELAWVLGLADQGNGYAAEAVSGMRDQLSAEGSTRFQAFIHPDHVASQAVAVRVGLARTGEIDDDGEEKWSSLQHPRSFGLPSPES